MCKKLLEELAGNKFFVKIEKIDTKLNVFKNTSRDVIFTNTNILMLKVNITKGNFFFFSVKQFLWII